MFIICLQFVYIEDTNLTLVYVILKEIIGGVYMRHAGFDYDIHISNEEVNNLVDDIIYKIDDIAKERGRNSGDMALLTYPEEFRGYFCRRLYELLHDRSIKLFFLTEECVVFEGIIIIPDGFYSDSGYENTLSFNELYLFNTRKKGILFGRSLEDFMLRRGYELSGRFTPCENDLEKKDKDDGYCLMSIDSKREIPLVFRNIPSYHDYFCKFEVLR